MGNRAEMAALLRSKDTYDLIVIGGGITGCGVAFEAAARGARVAVLERGDFAIGTSSRSTKLIHGGIRYLKQMDFRLVKEGVQERQALIADVPHLVHPIQFVYPVHAGDPDPFIALRFALVLYDWFAGSSNLLKHKVFPGKAILAEEPLLKAEGLQGGALYADCLTDDGRLTVEVAKAAAAHGAALVNYMEVTGFLYDAEGHICGVKAQDRLSGDSLELKAEAVLNASGPWVDLLRQLDEPGCKPVLRPTKGVHLAVDHARLPIRRPVVMHGTDNRLMFAVPRGEFTYLGTTDTDWTGDPAGVKVESGEVDYILAAANKMFPTVALTPADVVSAWAGIRTLAAASENAGPSQVSRDYKLHTSRSGLVSVAGGKLTAFQAMARAIVRRVVPKLSHDHVEMKLSGKLPDAAEKAADAARCGLELADVEALVSRHGGEYREVLWRLEAATAGGPPSRIRALVAEARFAVEREFAVTLTDVLNRRTWQLLFSRDNGREVAAAVAAAMAPLLGWDATEETVQVETYLAEVKAMMTWDRSLEPVGEVPVTAVAG